MEILKPKYWQEYQLLDFGNGIKIENFAGKLILRPETDAKKQLLESKKHWEPLICTSFYNDKKTWSRNIDDWEINYKSENINFKLSLFLGNSKHVGIFPEQAVNWEYIAKNLKKEDKFLNLFGYTGVASIVAAKICKQVSHIDSSSTIIKRAKTNAEINEVDNIRFITDDALMFCKKELKRGNKYNGIILDPPVFGFGAKGKSWKLTKNITELLSIIKLLVEKKSFIILNTYTPVLKHNTTLNILKEIFGNKTKIQYGKLAINDKNKNDLILNDYFIIEQ